MSRIAAVQVLCRILDILHLPSLNPGISPETIHNLPRILNLSRDHLRVGQIREVRRARSESTPQTGLKPSGVAGSVTTLPVGLRIVIIYLCRTAFDFRLLVSGYLHEHDRSDWCLIGTHDVPDTFSRTPFLNRVFLRSELGRLVISSAG